MSIDPETAQPDALVRDRVKLPGALLLCVGLINLLGGLLLLRTGIQIGRKAPAEFREEYRAGIQKLEELGFAADAVGRPDREMPMEQLQTINVRLFIGLAVLSLVGSFVTTYGGYNMRTINSYKMAVGGAVLAAIPCTSPASWCGLGLVVGVWALVVLLSRDVRSAFP